MPVEKPNKDSAILWQKFSNPEEGVPEPAILISPYSDVITLHQETNYININYASLDELIKVLKDMKKAQGQ